MALTKEQKQAKAMQLVAATLRGDQSEVERLDRELGGRLAKAKAKREKKGRR